LEKELQQLKGKLANNQGGELVSQAKEISGVKVLAVKVDGLDAKALRETMDQLKNKLGSCAIVLGVAQGKKVSLVAGVSKDVIAKIKAGDLVNHVASQVGGKGVEFDERMSDAIAVLLKKQRKDGKWPVQAKHPGETHFDMEETGKPSRWNTLRALRVLKHLKA